MKIYSDSIMKDLRQRFGIESDDTSLDEEIMKYDKWKFLEELLRWDGLYGFGDFILNALDEYDRLHKEVKK